MLNFGLTFQGKRQEFTITVYPKNTLLTGAIVFGLYLILSVINIMITSNLNSVLLLDHQLSLYQRLNLAMLDILKCGYITTHI
jgi:hypothetical protein